MQKYRAVSFNYSSQFSKKTVAANKGYFFKKFTMQNSSSFVQQVLFTLVLNMGRGEKQPCTWRSKFSVQRDPDTTSAVAENSNNNIIAPRGVHYQITCIKSADLDITMLTELKGKQPNLSLQGLIISGNYLRETQCQHPWASNEQ